MAKKEIKFPFKPNEKVRAAFRQERQMKVAIKLMTQALVSIAAEIQDPFQVLIEEHPEFKEYRFSGVVYSRMTEEFDIKN